MEKLNKNNIIIDQHSDYLKLFDEDDFSQLTWFGYCIQSIEVSKHFNSLNTLFRILHTQIDFLNAINWIVKHDDMDFPWIQNLDINNEFISKFKALFVENNIDCEYAGPLLLSKIELCSVLDELIYYPKNLSYKNIDIIPIGFDLIIKLTGHMDIQLISRNDQILNELIKFSSHETRVIPLLFEK
jgi:hypothetical protein